MNQNIYVRESTTLTSCYSCIDKGGYKLISYELMLEKVVSSSATEKQDVGLSESLDLCQVWVEYYQGVYDQTLPRNRVLFVLLLAGFPRGSLYRDQW